MKQLDTTTLARLTAWLEQEDDFVFLESSRLSAEDHRSLLFHAPERWLVCSGKDKDSVDSFLAEVDALRGRGYYLAGWLSYELSRLLEPRLQRFCAGDTLDLTTPLAVFGVFASPLIYDHLTDSFSGGTSWPAAEPDDRESSCLEVRPSLTRSQYFAALQRIQEYIHAGDTYQVNFTLHLDFCFQGSVANLYRTLRRNQSVAYGAWIRRQGRDILSFSPELFFCSRPGRVSVRPMKGTMVRGRTTAEDAALRERLSSDPKNRSENVMIVDLLRNDLACLLHNSGGGQVVPRSLFDVETYESLLQMTSTVDAVTADRRPLSFAELITALFPCGSVTGAPKIRTMEIIRELEQDPRGVYCGAIGYAGPEDCCFNVPIRTVELSGHRGRMGIGSGIVADSDPEAEWRECLLKGNFLTRSEPDFQLIETLLWEPDDGYFLLDLHLERLQDSARYFGFNFDRESVSAALDAVTLHLELPHRVRLLLFRDGSIEIQVVKLPGSTSSRALPRVAFVQAPVDPKSPFLYHKTTRRQLFDAQYGKGREQGFMDVLFVNCRGEVTEGAISNIFVRRQGKLLTPPLCCGLLAGTYRRFLLDQGRAAEEMLSREDVLAADEVYIANSVRGLVRVEVQEEVL